MSRTLAALALCLTAAATLPASTAQAHGPGGGAHRRPVAAVAAPAVRVMIEAPEGGAFANARANTRSAARSSGRNCEIGSGGSLS